MVMVGKSATMRAQYTAWPYPQLPLLAGLPSTHPFELHVDWLWDRAGSGPGPVRPRIWLAGCGTFQPYAFAVANPHAEITATDLSEASLAIARRRCQWHRQRHVRFAPVDLEDPATWPEGRFDLIECYGVLMNLADPQATLRGLRERLTDNGVLRLMVYPHWSRQRVFQLQRLARLLGFTADRRQHPAAFRTFVRRLPRHHPLRFAFTSYADSRNDAGVVDAFLHGGDRGFTAFQLGDLLAAAGLQPDYWFHRPWAQPEAMAERLGFADRPWSFVLDHLDLWQELRTNFIVCARRTDAPPRTVQPPRPHPAFVGDDHALRHRLRLLRLQWLGGKLPARTAAEAIAVPAGAARALARGEAPGELAGSALLLGGTDHGQHLPSHRPEPGEAAFLAAAAALRIGRRAPNPLYAHLFAAFERDRRQPELALPDLETQMGRWLPWADPLEQRPIGFGLSPYATNQRFRINIREHLEREPLPTAAGWGAVRLRQDERALGTVRSLLAAAPEVPTTNLDDASLRELFVLLCSHDQLFLCLDGTS
jgi:hypothetical protein